MIDWVRVAELREEIGVEDFEEVTELFLLEVEDTLRKLRRTFGDVSHTKELLHFLKGSALNLGFSELSELCSKGEVDVDGGCLSVDHEQIKAVYVQSRAFFQTEYARRFAA